MKTLIREIGVIDKSGLKHPVNFKSGLNIVTGKSSTGKSALIEIFDYCFGSSENTVPKGVITASAVVYYVVLDVEEQVLVVARDPALPNKAFFKSLERFASEDIQQDFFENRYFRPLAEYKKYLRDLFIDIDDVDESLVARMYRRRKASTPSIRSFSSFILQHQNLVANKHALFYRFDEKEKREHVIDHTKIFLGLVDQDYFHLTQEKERLTGEVNGLKKQQDANNRAAKIYLDKVEPVLSHLYSMMGFEEAPIGLAQVLRNPQLAKEQLDDIIVPEKIEHNSDAATKRYNKLKFELTAQTSELRKLQRKASSIRKHINEESKFLNSITELKSPDKVHVSTTVCPFCRTEKDALSESAVRLQNAIHKVSGNIASAKPMKAKFKSTLLEVERDIQSVNNSITRINQHILVIEKSEEKLAKRKTLYEAVLIEKAKLFMLLDTLNLSDDIALNKMLTELEGKLKDTNRKLLKYNVKQGLEKAAAKVNAYMADIGSKFEFENSYMPINLKFSFETFDLYHQTEEDEKIYLRSMGSGANWLYSHVTLFLALHKYFAELGSKCSIPSVLFLDQPTQVYFPNFKRDNSETFKEQKEEEAKLRSSHASERVVDEDIKAVENLFTQLAEYCVNIEEECGFSPQIIVTDHADDLHLSNEYDFESFVNGNRWRTRGLINPVPAQ
ncbi:DUF3732 domain-containing protein [Vibrio sp. Of14-4]|uniref:DUF3732 domain-containing protein n=1 Tax=Vibrio TaxID=662 RepID=UPI001EF2FB9F|nr:DUF3732 domain-containing protein [Vibrio sp. Of14-4]MCG7489278.1 DUF3732 domain-containing protein [Vibrio sp. Of14-4]